MFPMLFYAIIHVYHCASICLLPMIIYVYSSSHIQDDSREVQSFHKQPSLLRISRGLGSIPTNTYHLGMVGWFFSIKKNKHSLPKWSLKYVQILDLFPWFHPPRKNIAYLNGPLNIGVNPKQKTHGKNGGGVTQN